MFYLFFPLVCRVLKKKAFLAILFSAFVVVGPFARSRVFNHNPVWREYSYLGGMDAIALGCLTAMLVAHTQVSRRALHTLAAIGSALMVFILCFYNLAEQWRLEYTGLGMTVLAVGACMVITVAAQTQWTAPWVLAPLRWVGQRSYEIYLTHMFMLIAITQVYLAAGKPLKGVPLLFAAVIVVAALFGGLVARFYSEPMNHRLRKYWGDGPSRLAPLSKRTEIVAWTKCVSSANFLNSAFVTAYLSIQKGFISDECHGSFAPLCGRSPPLFHR